MPPKKGHKKTSRRKTIKKGGFYSFNGAVATGAADWGRGSEYGSYSVSNRGGNTQYGRGRKTKKQRKVKRGGSKFGAVSASYQGTGERGIINVEGVDTKGAPSGSAGGGAFNNFGAQPGSGYSSFVKAA